MTEYGYNLLGRLSEIFAPAGCEDAVLSAIEAEISAYCDEIRRDRAGNLIALIKAEKPCGKLLFATNADEVGFMITDTDDDGRLYITPLGPIETDTLSGRQVYVGNSEKTSLAVACAKPIHEQSGDERSKPTAWDKLYIQTGVKKGGEQNIKAGDFGTFRGNFGEIGHNIKGKALDTRADCAILCEMIKRIKEENIPHENDLYFAFTVRGKLNRSGAVNAARGIAADRAVVLEYAPCADISEIPGQFVCARLGGGAVFPLADMKTIFAGDDTAALIGEAETRGIKYQINGVVTGAGDAAYYQRDGGSGTVALAMPCRYPNTASCVINKEDYDSVLALSLALVK